MKVTLMLLALVPLAFAGGPALEKSFDELKEYAKKMGWDKELMKDMDGGMGGDSMERMGDMSMGGMSSEEDSSEENMSGEKKDENWNWNWNWMKEQKKEQPENNMYDEFRNWMKEQKKENKAKEEYKEFMDEKMAEFKEYQKMKEYKAKQEEEAKKAMYKEMMKIKMKKKMTEELWSMSKAYQEQKMKFMFGIASNFLDFCTCSDTKSIIMRVKEGGFGGADGMDMDMDDMMGGMMRANMSRPMGGRNESNSSMDDDDDDDEWSMKPSDLKEKAEYLARMEPEELTKKVFKSLVEEMCEAAKSFSGYLKNLEGYVREAKEKHDMMGGNRR